MKARIATLFCFMVLIGVLAGMRTAAAADDAGTLTSDEYDTTCGSINQFSQSYFGDNGVSGSYTPGLTGGQAVLHLYNITGQHGPICPALGAYLWISGFTSNPGSSWLTSATCNGGTLDESAATTFNYIGGGVAEWIWQGSDFNISTGTYSCTIVHD